MGEKEAYLILYVILETIKNKKTVLTCFNKTGKRDSFIFLLVITC